MLNKIEGDQPRVRPPAATDVDGRHRWPLPQSRPYEERDYLFELIQAYGYGVDGSRLQFDPQARGSRQSATDSRKNSRPQQLEQAGEKVASVLLETSGCILVAAPKKPVMTVVQVLDSDAPLERLLLGLPS